MLRIRPYPPHNNTIVIAQGAHKCIVDLAVRSGFKVIDYRNKRIEEAIGAVNRFHAVAIVGRYQLGKAYSKLSPDVFVEHRRNGLLLIKHLGQRYQGDPYMPLSQGIIVERTPRGNAEAVRIYQDLMLLCLLKHKIDDYKYNPASYANKQIKRGVFEKISWDRRCVTPEVNPESLDLSLLTKESEKSAEFLKGKKVAVIGAGKIGMEILTKSPFLKYTNKYIYDPNVKVEGIYNVFNSSSLDEALKDADVLLLQVSYGGCIVGTREINLLKEGAIICNMGRRKSIDPLALLRALETKKVSGACLDCHAVESDLSSYKKYPRQSKDIQTGHIVYKIMMMKQVIASFHSAAQEEVAGIINAHDAVKDIKSYIETGEVHNGLGVPDIQFPHDRIKNNGEKYIVVQIINNKFNRGLEKIKIKLNKIFNKKLSFAMASSCVKNGHGVTWARYYVIVQPFHVNAYKKRQVYSRILRDLQVENDSSRVRVFEATL